ncbi:APC family permease [Klenkia terrae]|uniref:APC family permease n=1 Tax=Klenkia terrae TaxID=1052259 RepID=A0ABU8E8H1_9ACTN
MRQPATLPARSPVAGLRRRRLSFVEVLAQSVSALAPSAAMVAVPALVLVPAGAATPWVLLAATALLVGVGWCLTQFARRMAAVGGLYSYTAKGLGPGGALVAGWALVIGYASVGVSALAGAGAYLGSLLGLAPTPLSSALLAALLGVAAVATTLRGIALSARVALALEVVSIALVVAVLTALVVLERGTGAVNEVTTATPGPGGLAVGAVLAVAGFMGFESASTLGVEARRPLVAVPRAVLWTPVVAGVLFLAAGAAQVLLLRTAPADVLDSAVPVGRLADLQGLGVLSGLLDAGIVASFFACVTGSVNALGRVLFSMGRERVLPAAAGRTSRRFGTPWVALLSVLPPVAGVPVVLLAAGVAPRTVLAGSLTVSAMGYLLAYVLACAAMPRFLRRIDELTPGPLVGGVLAAVLGSLVLLGAVLLGGAVVGVFVVLWLGGPLLWLFWRLRDPDRLTGVGVYDSATTGSVLAPRDR